MSLGMTLSHYIAVLKKECFEYDHWQFNYLLMEEFKQELTQKINFG